MYKIITIFYLLCFFSYVLFTRVPDFFDGDYVQGRVIEATFVEKNREPQVTIVFNAGSEKILYKTRMWFLTSYHKGQVVTMIYNPANPANCCIYAFIGYWIKWPEVIFTSTFFIVLFITARSISGKTRQ